MIKIKDRRSHYVQILFLTLFIILTALFTLPILKSTEDKMDELKNKFIQTLENAINYEISYKSISPSIFSYISIRDLIIYKDKENQIILAKIKSFKAFYSPFYFFKKESALTPLQALKRINISNADFNLNTTRENELLSLFKIQEESTISLLPLKTILSGKNINVIFTSELLEMRANNLFVNLTPEGNSYKTKIDGDLNLKFNEKQLILSELNSKISIRGTLAEYLDSVNFTVKTKNLKSNILDLKEQAFQILSSTEEIQIKKVQDARPLDLAFRYDRLKGESLVTFYAENFIPSSMLQFKGPLESLSSYASSMISGDGALLYHMDSSALLYSLNANIDLDRDLFERSMNLSTEFTGDNEKINISSLNLNTGSGSILFEGDLLTNNYFPSGTLSLKQIRSAATPIDVSFDIDRDDEFLYLSTESFFWGEAEFSTVQMVLFPFEKNITSSFKANLINPQGEDGQIVIDSIFEYEYTPLLNSYINLKSLPLSQVLKIFPKESQLTLLENPINDISLQSQISLSSDLKSLHGEVNDLSIYSNSNKENHLSLSAFYKDGNFQVNDLLIKWDERVLNGYVNAVKNNKNYVLSTRFDFEKKPYRIQAIINDKGVVLEGDYGISGFYNKMRAGKNTFTFQCKDFPIPFLKEPLMAKIDLNGYISDKEWKIYLNDSLFSSQSFYTVIDPKLSLKGEIDNSGLNFYNIEYNDALSSLKGLGRVNFLKMGINSWLSLKERSSEGTEQYDMRFTYGKDKNIDSRISIESSPIGRFSESGFRGDLSADILFQGFITDPQINILFKTDRVYFNDKPLFVESHIRGDKNVLRVSELELDYDGLIINRGLILGEFNKGKILATAGVKRIINDSLASSSLTALIKVDQSIDLFSLGKIKDSQIKGNIKIAPLKWDQYIISPELNINIDKKGNFISTQIERGKILDGLYNLDTGKLEVFVSDFFPISLKGKGTILNSEIQLSVREFKFDPTFINYFMPTDPFKNKRHAAFTGGSITGEFDISGKMNDPDFNGYLDATDILVETPYLSEIPEAVSTKAYLKGHTLSLEPLNIKLKDGYVEAYSTFEFDGALPTTFDVEVYIRGTSGARVAYEIPRFSWDGHFTGYAHINGSKRGGFLKADLLCLDLVSSLESKATFTKVVKKIKNPSVNGFIIDLNIRTGRDVNFYLPNQQVPIIQATAENGDNINISYDSRSDVLGLVGKIDIRSGEINYFNKTFYLQDGFMDFNESQVKFNPRINLQADVITKDEFGERVTISLKFDDYLLNEFKPEFSSSPKRSEHEILSMLGDSFLPSNDPDKISVASLLVATGGMIGKNTIMKPFEKAIKSSFELDFVSFNTDIIENAILDRLEEQELYDQNRQGMNFAKYLENTSLFVGEYIGDFLFLEGSLVVDYDDSNRVSSFMGGLDLNVNLNLQFITPFVLIDWTYNPKNNEGSEYFIPQNTITFTWQYSY